MQCTVHRSQRKADTYVYLRADCTIADLPSAVRDLLGALVKVMDLELTPDRRLAREDVEIVRANLAASGFHVQFPPGMVIPGS